MRVSPSGKAVASQATIRGFESHHPLKYPPPVGDTQTKATLNDIHRSGFMLHAHEKTQMVGGLLNC